MIKKKKVSIAKKHAPIVKKHLAPAKKNSSMPNFTNFSKGVIFGVCIGIMVFVLFYFQA